ncbi:5-guanidino-2-oxopentanoate decarboxylase [Exilibacterium tricleocarpae]|uniref:5-guanidino-2-oxopentanoate decarboxylase n=1 Tax=Exilibacterium tricleocarpae TaxID=2591008 RepID=A0A545TM39_9GAMM|nr:5-guanidino-2-oxopentanoate decarboxylase [Exilibacterium tricleocarpae]TQV78211.1 5-guanidino-2-oxopentanoate decarboxylase [Exilibacterium tricleocarpae]
MQTCGEQLVKLLQDYGIDTIFGIPGVHTVELYRGLEQTDIRHITPRHEQGAGFMADGYARATGRVAACFIITGPGMTNIATAMGQAYADSIPMLVISSTNRIRELGAAEGRLHELKNQRELVQGVAASSHTLLHPGDLSRVMARAFTLFASARPRPVHIEIPIDIIAGPGAVLPPRPVATGFKPGPCPAAIKKAATLLAAAERPVILFGGGAAGAGAAARRLVEHLDAPFTLTSNAKGLLPPGHPLSLGSNQSLGPVRELIGGADLVLAVGTELGETDYDFFFDGGFKIDGKLIRVDIDSEQLSKNFLADVAIPADANLFLTGVCAALEIDATDSQPQSPAALQVAAVRGELQALKDRAHLAHDRLFGVIQQTLPNAIVVGDSTQPVYSGQLSFEARQTRSWFHSATGFGTLGYGLPAAIGAQLGQPHCPVVALVGDGGAQFSLGELACAVENHLPVILLLWNNRGYREIKQYMQHNAIPTIGVDIHTPDFAQLARGFGAATDKAYSYEHLAELLGQAAARKGPTLVEIDESDVLDNWQ